MNPRLRHVSLPPPAAALACMAALFCLPAAGEFRWKISAVDEIVRPDETNSLSMSGITRVSNDVYWAVTDHPAVVWELSLPVDPCTGKPAGCRLSRLFEPERAFDVEGIAFDPLDGSVWLADEEDATVKRYDPRSGRLTGEAALPPAMKGFVVDSGLESLAIGGGGLEMWTCTEEALVKDGPRSTKTAGTDVRLTKLSRKSAGSPWSVCGQWIYRTDPLAGGPWYMSSRGRKKDCSRSGVSELCVLEDGTLLVLEREFSVVLIPRIRCRIYEVDLHAECEVSGVASLKGLPEERRARKKLLYETSGFAMYEGICPGPELADGSRLLVLVSDGDKRTVRSVLVLRLARL